MDSELDTGIRAAAFAQLDALTRSEGTLTWAEIERGFEFGGQRFRFASRACGIFRPKGMTHVLSIKTVIPRRGRKIWYDDQQNAHKRIFAGQSGIDYDFMGKRPDAARNLWLRDAHERQVPLVYFLGVKPEVYQAIFPVFVDNWDSAGMKARIVCGLAGRAAAPAMPLPDEHERRYAWGAVKRRLHQHRFRLAVLDAYGERCALTGLRVPSLIDAAHIIPDSSEPFGQPVVRNGLPLSKVHHAAFDRNLIGIDPDFRVHVSGYLLSEQREGPVLEAIKALENCKLRLPVRDADYPDQERLERRFAEFRNAA